MRYPASLVQELVSGFPHNKRLHDALQEDNPLSARLKMARIVVECLDLVARVQHGYIQLQLGSNRERLARDLELLRRKATEANQYLAIMNDEELSPDRVQELWNRYVQREVPEQEVQ